MSAHEFGFKQPAILQDIIVMFIALLRVCLHINFSLCALMCIQQDNIVGRFSIRKYPISCCKKKTFGRVNKVAAEDLHTNDLLFIHLFLLSISLLSKSKSRNFFTFAKNGKITEDLRLSFMP